jgi:hypothetical protein
VLLRLAYLGVTNTLTLLRLLPTSDRAKDTEILALRHQITVLERHLHGEKIRFNPADRAWFAALLHRLPRDVLRASGCWSARRRGCAGSVTWQPDGTPGSPGPPESGGHPPSGRSAQAPGRPGRPVVDLVECAGRSSVGR